MSNTKLWRLEREISRVAKENPENIAIELQGLSLSYAVLEHQSNRIAENLLSKGYGSGNYIAVVARNVAEFAIGCLAVMKSGAAYISLDLRYSHSRIENILQQGTADLILSSHWLPESLIPEGIPFWKEFDSWMIIGQPISEPILEHEENAPASLCYTSGTTGIPKGAIITHKGIEGLVCEPDFAPYKQSDRVAQLTTYAFDAATLEVWGALSAGACLVEVPKSLMMIPTKFESFLQEHHISSLWLTTSHFNAIVLKKPDTFKTLKTLFFGGEAVSVEAVKSVFACDSAPSRLLHVYGPTEATCLTTWHRICESDVIEGVIPIGTSLQGRQVSVRDEQLGFVPIGEEGELVITGPAIALGYINNKQQTEEKFVVDPLNPEQRLYRTGDRAIQNTQGDFICLGRHDDQIKVRGLRIETSAVIKALLDLDKVSAATVLTKKSESGTNEMIAFVQVQEGNKYSVFEGINQSDALRSDMANSVPDYMVPAQIHIVDHFPTTDSGKLDRKLMLLRLSNSKLDSQTQTVKVKNNSIDNSVKNTELEDQILHIWQRVLSRECSKHEDFFDLGGDSLKLIQVIQGIEAEFGYGLNTKDLQSPLTITGLAKRLTQNSTETKAADGAFLLWMRWWLLPVPEMLLHALGKNTPAQILDIPVSVSDVSKTQSFEHMADYLEKRLLEICPDGPYRLAGYSYTGLLAYELAQRLRARGKEVELLALLDSYCGKPLFHRRVLRVINNGIGKWLSHQVIKLCSRVSNKLKKNVPQPAKNNSRPEAQYYYSSIASARNHQTAPYSGKTLVIETTDKKAFTLPRWNNRLMGEFKVVKIEGNHESIMKRPSQTQKMCQALEEF